MKCSSCNTKSKEMSYMKSKDDGLIYCESCVDDLVETEIDNWIDKHFEEID